MDEARYHDKGRGKRPKERRGQNDGNYEVK